MSQTPKKGQSATSGERSSTAHGRRQLSYIAASSRNTNTMARMSVGIGDGAVFSWYDSAEDGKPISLGIDSANTAASAASACPDVKPRPGAPLISTERNRLKRVVISGLGVEVIVTGVESGIIALSRWLRT